MEGVVSQLTCGVKDERSCHAAALVLPISVYKGALLSFSLLGLSRSNFMLSDAKTTDFFDSCSIPFPSLLLYFYPSYSFLLVTRENLYHLLTTLGYKFSCIFFPTLSSQLLCLGPIHFIYPDAFSVMV